MVKSCGREMDDEVIYNTGDAENGPNRTERSAKETTRGATSLKGTLRDDDDDDEQQRRRVNKK